MQFSMVFKPYKILTQFKIADERVRSFPAIENESLIIGDDII